VCLYSVLSGVYAQAGHTGEACVLLACRCLNCGHGPIRVTVAFTFNRRRQPVSHTLQPDPVLCPSCGSPVTERSVMLVGE
jgi:hypothetical protein